MTTIGGLLGDRRPLAVAVVHLVLAAAWLLPGVTLRSALQTAAPELLLEIPPYRLPSLRAAFAKFWMRASGVLREAVPLVSVSVLVMRLLQEAGGLQMLGRAAARRLRSLGNAARGCRAAAGRYCA